MVREVGVEPTRHCWRQDLNLVRLPIPPSSLSYTRAANIIFLGLRILRLSKNLSTFRAPPDTAWRPRSRRFVDGF